MVDQPLVGGSRQPVAGKLVWSTFQPTTVTVCTPQQQTGICLKALLAFGD